MSQTTFMSIDFGTTNSVMAAIEPETGRPEVILNRDGNFTTPSLAYYADNETVVGSRVQEMISDLAMLDDAERAEMEGRIVKSVKREFREQEVLSLSGDRELEPVQVVADILSRLKSEAEETHFHKKVTHVVLTHPATFDGVQTRLLKTAARSAGFEQIMLLAEPESAALAYARCGQNAGETVLVFDLGGGTLDLAVVHRNGDGRYHLAMEHDGDARCGGDDMDRALYDHWEEQIRKEHGRGVAKEDGEIFLPFLMECRKRKENLSEQRTLPPFRSLLPGNHIVKLEADKASFEKLITPLVSEMARKTQRMVQRAKDLSIAVDTVVLIGGASQTPLVKEKLKEVLPVEPRSWQLQHVAVALGAALYANDLWDEQDKVQPTKPSESQHVQQKTKSQRDNHTAPATKSSDPADRAGSKQFPLMLALDDGTPLVSTSCVERYHNAPPPPDRDLVAEILHATFGPFAGTYCYGAITYNKLRNTRELYRPFLTDGEDVLLVHDMTFFGGAKEGFVVTDSGIGWKKSMFDPPSFMSFEASEGGRDLPQVVFGHHFPALIESIRQIEMKEPVPPPTSAPASAIEEIIRRHFSNVDHVTLSTDHDDSTADPEGHVLLRYGWRHEGHGHEFILTDYGIQFVDLEHGAKPVIRRYDQVDADSLRITTRCEHFIQIIPTERIPMDQWLLTNPIDKRGVHWRQVHSALKATLAEIDAYDERRETLPVCELVNDE